MVRATAKLHFHEDSKIHSILGQKRGLEFEVEEAREKKQLRMNNSRKLKRSRIIKKMKMRKSCGYFSEQSCFRSKKVDTFSESLKRSGENEAYEFAKVSSIKNALSRDQFNAVEVNSLPKVKSTTESLECRCNPNSDGVGSCLDEKGATSVLHFVSASTVSTCRNSRTSKVDIELSPEKALRVAMLKKRFADTILKAQEKALLHLNDQADPTKVRLEKKRSERRQREEKAATIRSQREAARIALEKVERSVDVEDNTRLVRDLVMLAGDFIFACDRSPLEKLGLRLKDEYNLGEVADEILLAEEGEILET